MKPNILERSWRWLARPGLLAVLVFALLALLLLGSFVPQAPDIPADAAEIAEWRALMQARYGVLHPLLQAAGAYRMRQAPLLWGTFALLGIATLACITLRWRGYWQAAFDQQVRLQNSILDSVSHTCVLAATGRASTDPLEALADVAARRLRALDYRVRIESGPTVVWLRGDRNRLAPLGTLAEHLAIIILLVGVAVSLIFGWRETLSIESGGSSEVGHGTETVVGSEGFEIIRYDDGTPSDYAVQAIIQTASTTESRSISVNRPARVGSTRLYLEDYRSAGDGIAVTLLAVHDPGFGVVLGGALLFLTGIIASLYFGRSTVHLRITRDGVLRLSGWADPRAYDFDREFAEVTARLRSDMALLGNDSAGPEVA